MWQKDRHQRIRALLSMLGQISNERIMADLGMSRETVRRDLLDLEEAGALRRVHGGAVPAGDEAPITERAHAHVRAKMAIARMKNARLAVKSIGPDPVIGLLTASVTLVLVNEPV